MCVKIRLVSIWNGFVCSLTFSIPRSTSSKQFLSFERNRCTQRVYSNSVYYVLFIQIKVSLPNRNIFRQRKSKMKLKVKVLDRRTGNIMKVEGDVTVIHPSSLTDNLFARVLSIHLSALRRHFSYPSSPPPPPGPSIAQSPSSVQLPSKRYQLIKFASVYFTECSTFRLFYCKRV